MAHYTRAVRPLTLIEVALLVAFVVGAATIATLLLGDIVAGSNFDLSVDPASGLWTW